MYRKNVASQFIYFQMNKTADGTGLTGATVAVRRCIDGTFAAATGTVTEDALGLYKFAASQADMNGNDIGFQFTATGGIAVEKTIVTTAADPTDSAAFGLSRLDAAITTRMATFTPLTAAQIATGVWQDTTAGDFTTALSVGKSLMNGVTLGTGLTVNQLTTNNDKTGYSLTQTFPTNFSSMAIDASGRVDLSKIVGAAVSTTTAQLGVNAVKYNNQTAQTDANNLPKVDVEAVNAATLPAQALAQSAQSICWGTCSGGTTTTAVVSTLNNPSSLTDSGQLIGRTIIFLGNTTTANQQSQASNITASTTGATPTLTFTAMTHAPANGDVFVIL